MILVGLEAITKKQLGSTHNLGYGVVNYIISQEDGSDSQREVIVSSTNERNIFNPLTDTRYSNEEKSYIKAFNDWLENITEENILLSNILVANKK